MCPVLAEGEMLGMVVDVDLWPYLSGESAGRLLLIYMVLAALVPSGI